MSDAELEPAARRLCEIRGIDPDMIGPERDSFWSYAIWTPWLPMWKWAEKEIRPIVEREQALRETINKPQEGSE